MIRVEHSYRGIRTILKLGFSVGSRGSLINLYTRSFSLAHATQTGESTPARDVDGGKKKKRDFHGSAMPTAEMGSVPSLYKF